MASYIERRKFLGTLGGVAAWPLAARAQQVSTRRPLVAVLSAVTRERNLPLNAFVQGMREFGYVEGENIDIEYRFAEGRLDRFPALADELVRLSPNVIVALVTPAAVATRALTQTIPIVCPLLADPIHFGLIASGSGPGGNVTGVADVVTIGFVVNVASSVIIDRQELEHACQKLGIKSVPAEVRAPNDLDRAFRALSNDHVQAVIVLVDGMLFSERTRIAALAAAARLPTIYGFRDHVDAGGLVSYGVNLAENFHRAAAICRWSFQPNWNSSSTKGLRRLSD
jgi:ABC-type uncharacterized transport system substrate-binding protein